MFKNVFQAVVCTAVTFWLFGTQSNGAATASIFPDLQVLSHIVALDQIGNFFGAGTLEVPKVSPHLDDVVARAASWLRPATITVVELDIKP